MMTIATATIIMTVNVYIVYRSGHNDEHNNCSKYLKQMEFNGTGDMGDGRVEKQTGDREALRDQQQQETEGPKKVEATQQSHSHGGLCRGGWSPEETQPGGKERGEEPWLPFLLLSPLPVAKPRQRLDTQPAGAEASRGGREWN